MHLASTTSPALAGGPAASPRPASASDVTAFVAVPAIALGWIVRLRWGAVLGQAVTVAAATFVFGSPLPVAPLSMIIAATALSNAALHRWMQSPRAVSPPLVAVVLAVDTMLLSALLYFSGGPSNPFSVLFLVQITIAALVLGLRYTAVIVALSAASYAFLFFDNVPLAGMEHMHHGGNRELALHLQGMFAAFTLAAILIAYFVTRVSLALRQRDAQLAEAQRLAASNEKLASLSTLAAGAAHELGTPHATIAVSSRELERAAQAIPGAESLCADARLIRQEVDRCRDIVRQMSARAGDPIGEVAERVEVRAIVSELRRRLPEARAARLDVRLAGAESFTLPWRGLVQALVSLVNNAFDASDASEARGRRVLLSVGGVAERVACFEIVDEGSGIDPSTLARVGEPFFTTKPPGVGTGLGVFLARAFADRLGGTFALTSARGQGTKVVLEIPLRSA
jgi:two-component system sensor histidine kinase RegB